MTQRLKNTETISVTLPPELLIRLRTRVTAEDDTISRFVRRVVRAELERLDAEDRDVE